MRRPRRRQAAIAPAYDVRSETDFQNRLRAVKCRNPRNEYVPDIEVQGSETDRWSRDMKDSSLSAGRRAANKTLPGQVVLVLQGGGALGSYQIGVYQALHEAGIEPDWIIGTSIGAINASLIAGNEPENRLPRLREFWKRMEQRHIWDLRSGFPGFNERLSYWSTITHGIAGFFRPNPLAHAGDAFVLGPERAGFYTTAPLQKTLEELVDFDLVNRCRPRLTVGAAHVRTSHMHYFDSRDGVITVKHVMASGALPPAFPAVRIDGELHWDGGILSNTPTEAVFDDNPRKDSLIFSVHLWNPLGSEPTTMAEVFNRHKDVQYSSRIASQIVRQQQIHRLRHVINQLTARLPESERNSAVVKELSSYGCQTRMHVVRLLAPQLDRETHTKDIDFTPGGIKQRWEAGYAHTKSVLSRMPWAGEFDPLSGVVFHEHMETMPQAAE
jgi:NTE family protein